MEIVEKKVTVHASISGVDFKGAVNIVNNKIELIEIEFHTKGTAKEISIVNEEQARSLVHELSRVLGYIDQERESQIAPVDFEEEGS